MFESMKVRLRDVRTIKQLCEAAESHALAVRQRQPGAEHFLLAALDLQDGTARLAFERVGADATAVGRAIENQYTMALHSIGLSVAPQEIGASPMDSERGAYLSTASGQEVMQALARSRSQHTPLLGAHVVSIIADMPHGVAARALRSMGVDPAGLRAAAEEIASSRTAA